MLDNFYVLSVLNKFSKSFKKFKHLNEITAKRCISVINKLQAEIFFCVSSLSDEISCQVY